MTVTLKHVDMDRSSLGGYLEIQHLTDSYPKLTTYFEGEIVDNERHSFVTSAAAHPDWGTTEKTDCAHWNKFSPSKPYSRFMKTGVPLKHWKERSHLFMRWKEMFLIPNHDVSSLPGASYEGFYYICFNQLQGEIQGIYYHQNSEKYGHVCMRLSCSVYWGTTAWKSG